MTNRVAITGVGAITPLGVGKDKLFDGLVEGRTSFSFRSFNEPERFSQLSPAYVGMIEEFPVSDFLGRKKVRMLGRESQVLMSAAVLACRDAQIIPGSWGRESVGVFTATNFAGLESYVNLFVDGLTYGADVVNPSQGPQTGLNAPSSQLAIHMGAEGPNVTLCSGATSGLEALSYAAEFIRERRMALGLVGGVETLSFFSTHALASHSNPACESPKPFDRDRRGPVLAEAGVVFVVEDLIHARARGARVLAELGGEGHAFEPEATRRDLERASVRAIEEGLRNESVEAAEVEAVFASANGHRVGDASEANVLHQAFGDKIPVYAVKGSVGECFAAGSTLQVAAALLSLNEGVVPATQGFETPDPELPPLRVTREPIAIKPKRVMVHSLDPHGYAATLLLNKPGG
jgi:3-oxoacyl-[acyl-carrier-protein] synthase II